MNAGDFENMSVEQKELIKLLLASNKKEAEDIMVDDEEEPTVNDKTMTRSLEELDSIYTLPKYGVVVYKWPGQWSICQKRSG